MSVVKVGEMSMPCFFGERCDFGMRAGNGVVAGKGGQGKDRVKGFGVHGMYASIFLSGYPFALLKASPWLGCKMRGQSLSKGALAYKVTHYAEYRLTCKTHRVP